MLSSSRERISIHIGGSETHQPIKEYTSGIKAKILYLIIEVSWRFCFIDQEKTIPPRDYAYRDIVGENMQLNILYPTS
jgi:hypothetical protein